MTPLDNDSHWVMSSRKLSMAEHEKIWHAAYMSFDLFDLGVDYSYCGNAILEAIRFGGNKGEATAYLNRLNGGLNPWDEIFAGIDPDCAIEHESDE